MRTWKQEKANPRKWKEAAMSNAERNEQIKAALREYTKKITVSPEAARNALIKEGIYTKSGKLSKNYSQGMAEKR
jgi:hypothetical protein